MLRVWWWFCHVWNLNHYIPLLVFPLAITGQVVICSVLWWKDGILKYFSTDILQECLVYWLTCVCLCVASVKENLCSSVLDELLDPVLDPTFTVLGWSICLSVCSILGKSSYYLISCCVNLIPIRLEISILGNYFPILWELCIRRSVNRLTSEKKVLWLLKKSLFPGIWTVSTFKEQASVVYHFSLTMLDIFCHLYPETGLFSKSLSSTLENSLGTQNPAKITYRWLLGTITVWMKGTPATFNLRVMANLFYWFPACRCGHCVKKATVGKKKNSFQTQARWTSGWKGKKAYIKHLRLFYQLHFVRGRKALAAIYDSMCHIWKPLCGQTKALGHKRNGFVFPDS